MSNFSKTVEEAREANRLAAKNNTRLKEVLKAPKPEPNVFELKQTQKKRFMEAHTKQGIVYFNLIRTLIKEGSIKPPKGLNDEQFMEAYEEALLAVGEKEMAKSIKKNKKL